MIYVFSDLNFQVSESFVKATVWGLTVRDLCLASRGCRNMLLGAAICLLYGAIFGAILGSCDTERDLLTPVGEDEGTDVSLRQRSCLGATSYISINTLQISSRGPPIGRRGIHMSTLKMRKLQGLFESSSSNASCRARSPSFKCLFITP